MVLPQQGFTGPPKFQIDCSLRAWKGRRPRMRERLRRLLGDLPAPPQELNVQSLGLEHFEDYAVEKLSIDNGAGAQMPAYLLLPVVGSGRIPGVLYCHWHGGEYGLGKEELFQSVHTPEAPGPALARRGFAVLCIDSYCFGERNGSGPAGLAGRDAAGEMEAAKFFLWAGGSLWGMMLRDDLIAIRYLCTRPEVDAERVGIIGMSMGATRAWWLMALEERIRTGVAICCLTRYQDLIRQKGLNEHGIYYYVPGLLREFEAEHIVALIAPRPVLFLNGDRDGTSPAAGIRAISRAVRPVYRRYDADDLFGSFIYRGQGHVLTRPMWERSMKWLSRHLSRPITGP